MKQGGIQMEQEQKATQLELTNQKHERKILSPKLDVVFQAIFGEAGSEKITARFLQSILQREINEVDLSRNVILRREQVDDKLGILDVMAKINGKENYNIEIQLVDKGNIVERILYYWARVYTKELKKGQDYEELQKTIGILIANFEIQGLEELGYHTNWKIIEEKERKIVLTDKLEIHILMLPKVAEKNENQEELIDWLTFLENPNSERVQEKMKENEELKKAVEKVNTISDDEYMQRIAELRKKAILDDNTFKRHMREAKEELKETKEELKIQKRELEGTKEELEGTKEELQVQKEKMKTEKLEMAKKLLKSGVAIELIINTTGLTKEEIMN